MKKLLVFVLPILLLGCDSKKDTQVSELENNNNESSEVANRVNEYSEFTLTSDMTVLTKKQQMIIPILIEACQIMDELYWRETYGDREEFLTTLNGYEKRFAEINYGPWDRLRGNEPFIEGVGQKPAGAQFYPADMTKQEFDAWDNPEKIGLYSFVRRDESGSLITIPYREMFAEEVGKVSELLLQAADLAENPGLKNYLIARSKALLTDEYQDSDMAWMDMKDNTLELIIGPIEVYEDQLFNYRAAHEGYVLIKDKNWSDRLSKYSKLLPELQAGLPVADAYKQEMPGSDSELNAYDVVFYAGDCNAGSKTIAINLPNDEEVQLTKGSRRLQLKNVIRAKFDKIMVPMADLLIEDSQRKHVTSEAFFANTMFHEVAHGLGIKNTINENGTVRQALKERASTVEIGKADILGVYMVTELHELGEIEGDLMDYYTTFLAGVFRSIRFGASSAHGKANLIRFNYFLEKGAFKYNRESGRYSIDFKEFQKAMESLSSKILTLQGDGNYEGVNEFFDNYGSIDDDLERSINKVNEAGIPRDIVFNQGVSVLGL